MSKISLMDKFFDLLPIRKRTAEEKVAAARKNYQRQASKLDAAAQYLKATKADITELDNMLIAAERELTDPPSVEGYEAAVKEFKKSKDVLKKINKAVEKSTDAEATKNFYRNKFLLKRDRLRKAINDLKQVPGGGPQVRAWELQLTTAEDLAKDETKYKEAYEAMDGLSKAEKNAEKNAGEAIRKLPDDGKKTGAGTIHLRAAYDRAVEALEAYGPVATPSDEKAAWTTVSALLDKALTAHEQYKSVKGDGPKQNLKNKMIGFEEELDKETMRLRGLTVRLGSGKESAERLQGQLTNKLSELRVLCPMDAVTPIDSQLGSALKEMSNTVRNFNEAYTILTTAISDADKLLGPALKAKTDYTNLADKISSLLNEIRLLQKVPASKAGATAAEGDYSRMVQMANGRQYAPALVLYAKVLNGVADLKKLVAGSVDPQVKNAVQSAEQIVRPKLNELDEKVNLLAERVKRRGGKGAGQFVKEAERITAAWAFDSAAAADVKMVEDAKSTALDAILAAVNEIDPLLKDKAAVGVTEMANGDKKAAALAAFVAEEITVGKLMETLETQVGGSTADPFRAEYAKLIKPPPPEDLQAALAAMKDLGKRAQAAINQATTAVTNARGQVTTKAKIVADRIDALPAGRQFKAFTRELKAELDDIRAIATNGNISACTVAMKDLEAMLSRIDKMKPGPNNDNKFSLVKVTLKRVRKKIEEDEPLRKCLFSRRQELQEQWKTKAGVAFSQDPDTTLEELLKFETAVKLACQEAAAHKVIRDRNEIEIKELKKLMKQAGITEKVPQTGQPRLYYANLMGRLDEAEKRSDSENQEAEAEADLKLIRQEIIKFDPQLHLADLNSKLEEATKRSNSEKEDEKQDGLLTAALLREQIKNHNPNPDVIGQLAKLEGDLTEKARLAAADKIAWETEYENFKHTLAEVKKAVAVPDGDEALYDGVNALYKQAEKDAKTENFADARKTLAQAAAEAKAAIARPQGRKLDARANVGKQLNAWIAAIGKFDEEAKSLQSAITEWANTQPEETKKAALEAAAAVGSLPDLFKKSEGEFAGPIGLLGKPGTTPDARKAAREEALALIRRYVAVLTKDKVLSQTQKNPFQAGLFGAAGGLQLTLNQMRLNVLLAV